MFDCGRVQVVHRWVLGLAAGDGMIGDHRSGNRLDNRRSNLRVVNPSGSSQNVAGRGKSKYRGVHPTRSGRWIARVKFRGKTYMCGTYDSEQTAAEAADIKRRELMPFYVPANERAS
ncbi:HNH endonuclease [Micromonospora pisi]|nr:HNH endonuclease [Micromonospora pisi]